MAKVEDWLKSLVVILFVVMLFVYLITGCAVSIVEGEQSAVCRYVGYEKARITWEKLPRGYGDYSVECIDYIPLKVLK